MAYQLFNLPPQQPLSAAGRVLPGAKLYFYETGTTNAAPVYTTSALNVAHSQPLVADSGGRFATVYLDPAVIYKATVTDSADALLYTVDPVNDQLLSGAIIGEYLYPRTAAEISAGVTPVNYAYPPGDVRRYGAVGDGVTEDTQALQNALYAGSGSGVTVYLPKATYLTGMLFPQSNTRILIESGTLILDTGVLQDTVGVADRLINIYSEDENNPIQNVHIIAWGATVQLIRANYGSGEQRHCVNIAGAVDNICIEGLTCIDGGGDGFYVGCVGGGLTLTPDNVTLIDCTADNNRRNGFSVTAGRNVKLIGCRSSNANGTSPEFGYDIEPDQDGSGNQVGDLTDIVLDGCYSTSNNGTGFAANIPYETPSQRITVTIINCVSIGDNVNFQMSASKNGANGLVSFLNCWGFEAETNGFDCPTSGMYCSVDGMRIFNANQSGGSVERFGSSYAVYSVNQTDGSTYGNVRIVNSYAFGTSPLKTISLQLVGEPASVIQNVDAEIWTDAAGDKRSFYALSAAQCGGKIRIKFTDETEIATTVSLGTSSMVPFLNNIMTNEGASGQVVLDLSDTISRLPGIRVTGRCKAAQNFILNPSTGWTAAGGASLWTNRPGAEVTLESDPDCSTWRIVQGGEGWFPEPGTLANSATPSIAGGTVWKTGGTTTITNLTDGHPYLQITLLAEHTITITDGTNIFLSGSANFTMDSTDTLTLFQRADGKWYEVARSDNT